MELPWRRTDFPTIRWPGDARVAVLVNSEFEPLRRPELLPDGSEDLRADSIARFEADAALPRILDLLDRLRIPQTVYVPGACAEAYPDHVREIARRGHEIAAHGWLTEDLWDLGEAAERELVDRAASAVAAVTGEQPAGWLSPKARVSRHTLRLLAERGFIWNSDLFDAELPYVVDTGAGTIVEIPRSFSTDDIALPNTSPRTLFEAWKDEFDWVYAESAAAPRMFMITLHYFISGRPSRAKALADVLEHIAGHDGVWFARNREVVAGCLASAG